MNKRKTQIFQGILILAIIGNTLYTSHGYLSGYIKYRAGNLSLEDYASNHTMLGYYKVIASKIAAYIHDHSNMGDTILNWSELAQIPYLANRSLSTDTVWPLHLANLGDPLRAFNSKPLYIIVGSSFIPGESIPDWLDLEISKNYYLENKINEYFIYRRLMD